MSAHDAGTVIYVSRPLGVTRTPLFRTTYRDYCPYVLLIHLGNPRANVSPKCRQTYPS
jgi:hypothetical protein